MSTALATTPRTLVALSPQDMPQVQAELVAWCRGQIVALSKELAEARQNLRQVKHLMLGSPKGWQNVVRKTIGRMIYYSKIQAALKAGYLIVPNFPVEVIAVRVNRAAPPTVTQDAWPRDVNQAKPELNLPAGVGRYVDETNPHEDRSYDSRIPDGKGGVTVRHHRLTRVDSYDETVDFPMAFCQPVILAATEHAMALKIFDRVGVAHNGGTTSRKQRRSDPIVIGQIFDGSEGWSRWATPKHVSFFIAWWLDPRSL